MRCTAAKLVSDPNNSVEGKRILEPVKDTLVDTLLEMEEDIQSAISYAGARKLMDNRKVNYVNLGGDNAGEHLLM